MTGERPDQARADSTLVVIGIDEALGLLGVERSANRDQVRRAYLRLVKTASPERDPERFQRLRAAYDLVRTIAPPGKSIEDAAP